MKTIRKYIFFVACFIISFLALYFSYRDLENQVDKMNTDVFTKEISLEVGAETSGVIDISVMISQSWDDYDEEGHSCKGGQYDFTVTNNSDETISGWSLVMHLPKEGRIDSYWSGEFFNEGTDITFVPGAQQMKILPGETQSFGFIMYSGVLYRIQDFTFSGSYAVNMTELPAYRRILGCFYLWIVTVIVYIAFEYIIYRAEKKRERDMRIIVETMETFSSFIDAKDSYTRGHSKRVSQYVKQMAKRMKFSKEDITRIGYIALMHDCGKIGIPDSVLNKPGALTPQERKVIESHVEVGGRILEHYTAIEGIREGALYHHEWYDGTGYPEGLKGEEIPIFARIIGVADSFDAMNSDRCYRKHLPKDVIIQELEKNSGRQFDPEVAKCMIELIKEGVIPCADD